MRIIIIGAGQVGYHIASRLISEDKDVVMVDKDRQVLETVAESLDLETVHGSGSSPRVLEQAGIRHADTLLAVTDSDEVNLIACTFSNILAPELNKVARIRNPEYTEYEDILAKDLLHIDIVVNPEEEVIRSIERLMDTPGAADVNEFPDIGLKLVGIWIREDSPFAGLNLAALKQKLELPDFIVASIIREERLIIPSGSNVIKPGDLVYFVCTRESLVHFLQAFGLGGGSQHNVLIIGGGNIGYKLAQRMEGKKGTQVKLLDRDRERCQFLAENLNQTIVLQGDGTDQRLLTEENVGSMDVVISLTEDEENNILSSLLAKSMGAKTTVTRINKLAYMGLMHNIGLELIVSPRLSAANSILRHVRKGTVISSVSIKEEAEAMEVRAGERSLLVNRPLKDIGLPHGVLILCLVREGKVIIPGGDSVIFPQDRVMLISSSKDISKVEKALMGE
ncbi:MAG: Trk system potassium transporter TrkA [Desulfohalobiaceae bacterium]